MNLLDILIVNILVFCVVMAFFRGIVKEALSIVGIVVAFFLTSNNYSVLAHPLSGVISNNTVINIISFFILFAAVAVGIEMTGIIFHKSFFYIVFNRLIDYTFGTLLGFAKAILLASVVFIVLTTFLPKGSPLLKESLFSPSVAVVSDKMALFVTQKVKHQFFTKRIALENSWEDRS